MDAHARFDRFVAAGNGPMFVVAAAAAGRTDACLVGFATQVSIFPPRFAVAISKKNRTSRVIGDGPATLAVHLVREEDGDAARWFGGETGDETDKLALWPWEPGPDGAPLIDALPERIVGREAMRLDAGDHTLIVLDPIEVHGSGDVVPFTLDEGVEIDPGHPA